MSSHGERGREGLRVWRGSRSPLMFPAQVVMGEGDTDRYLLWARAQVSGLRWPTGIRGSVLFLSGEV